MKKDILIDFAAKKREKALLNFPPPKPIRKMTKEERESTAEKLAKEK